ncbi:hypothetical protein CHS0354_000151, partial [Potamilus streckersoni]
EVAQRCSSCQRLWIGATRLYSSATWKWLNENIMEYTNWGNGEPNNIHDNENCAEVIPAWNSKWNDLDCSSSEGGYICEKFTPCNALRPNSLRCKHGGTCHNAGPIAFKCECPPNFTGNECELDVNECEFYPCQNGASCNNTIGDYNCHCPSRYTGKNCQLGTFAQS